VSNHSKSLVQVRLVVVDHVDTRELSERLDKDCEDKALAVAGPCKQFSPSSHMLTLLKTQLLTHLIELCLNKSIVLTFVPVQTPDHCKSLIVTFFLKKPTRRVWKPEDSS
jgi:hypothetical protein